MKIRDKIRNNKRKTQLIILALIFVCSGFSLLLIKHDRDAKKEVASLSPEANTIKPSQNTTLYFVDDDALPKTYTPGQDLKISFIIRNQEGKTVDYVYAVTVNDKQVATHDIKIKNKTTQTVNQAFTLPTDQQALTVKVLLAKQNKTIQFTLERAK